MASVVPSKDVWASRTARISSKRRSDDGPSCNLKSAGCSTGLATIIDLWSGVNVHEWTSTLGPSVREREQYRRGREVLILCCFLCASALVFLCIFIAEFSF